MRFSCRRCGQAHELPEALSAGVPEPCLAIPPGEREARVVVGDETCQLDDHRYFVRGNVELPLDPDLGAEPFVWTLWVELDRKRFKRALALWMRDARVREPPYPATLASSLPLYPETVGVAAELTTRAVGVRPVVRVLGDHPLADEQRRGASRERLAALAEGLAHGG